MRLSNEYIISIIDQNKLSPPVYALAVQFLQKILFCGYMRP